MSHIIQLDTSHLWASASRFWDTQVSHFKITAGKRPNLENKEQKGEIQRKYDPYQKKDMSVKLSTWSPITSPEFGEQCLNNITHNSHCLRKAIHLNTQPVDREAQWFFLKTMKEFLPSNYCKVPQNMWAGLLEQNPAMLAWHWNTIHLRRKISLPFTNQHKSR